MKVFVAFCKIASVTGISSTLRANSSFFIHFACMLGQLANKLLYSWQGRLFSHLLFWVFSLGFLSIFFGRIGGDYAFSFRFACLLLPVVIGTTYFINYKLIPSYLFSRKYGKFVLYFVYTLIFSIWAELLVLIFTFSALAQYKYQNLGPVAGDFLFQLVGLYIIVLFGVALKVLKLWMRAERARAELKNASLEAELKLKEAELQLLKGQIHPHFLFNTLNNLYGLALEKSEIVPASIIRLSELLDFLLYRSNSPLVPLEDEIKLIGDYIELEKLRFGDRMKLQFDVKTVPSFQIAPFLLFPFVENAIKHGFSQNEQELSLVISIVTENSRLLFSVKNSCAAELAPAGLGGGVGLSNVKKRLQLLYPRKHKLNIEKNDAWFMVSLNLDLTSDNAE